MSRFEDRRPIRRLPKSITVRVGIYRIVRGRDDWVILGRHGKFMGTAPLLQEAEDWAHAETSRLAEQEAARIMRAEGITKRETLSEAYIPAEDLPDWDEPIEDEGGHDWDDEPIETPTQGVLPDGTPYDM